MSKLLFRYRAFASPGSQEAWSFYITKNLTWSSNIDRYIAIWQSAHPSAWFTRQKSGQVGGRGNFVTPPGWVETPQTPLLPFRKSAETPWWTSDLVRDWTTLGCEYPDIKFNDPTSQDPKGGDEMKMWLWKKYRWLSSLTRESPNAVDKQPPSDFDGPTDVSKADVFTSWPPPIDEHDPKEPSAKSEPVADLPVDTSIEEKAWDVLQWFVKSQVQK